MTTEADCLMLAFAFGLILVLCALLAIALVIERWQPPQGSPPDPSRKPQAPPAPPRRR